MNSTMMINQSGDKIWFNAAGDLHREDGPAIEFADGSKLWYINGKFHREDGPACEYTNGNKYWFINDAYLTEQEFNTYRLTML